MAVQCDSINCTVDSISLKFTPGKQDGQYTYNINIVVHLQSVCTSYSVQTVIPFQVKRAIQWRFNVTGNNKIFLGLHNFA